MFAGTPLRALPGRGGAELRACGAATLYVALDALVEGPASTRHEVGFDLAAMSQLVGVTQRAADALRRLRHRRVGFAARLRAFGLVNFNV